MVNFTPFQGIGKNSTIFSPVFIDGNEELRDAALSGFGNQTHPYNIGHYDIRCNNGSQTGIQIKNTDKYFIVDGGEVKTCGTAIKLTNVTNGLLRYLFIGDNNGYGMYFWKTSYSTVLETVVENNTWGIYLNWSSHNEIIQNWVNNNTEGSTYGIYVYNSSNNLFENNTVLYNRNGFAIGTNCPAGS